MPPPHNASTKYSIPTTRALLQKALGFATQCNKRHRDEIVHVQETGLSNLRCVGRTSAMSARWTRAAHRNRSRKEDAVEKLPSKTPLKRLRALRVDRTKPSIFHPSLLATCVSFLDPCCVASVIQRICKDWHRLVQDNSLCFAKHVTVPTWMMARKNAEDRLKQFCSFAMSSRTRSLELCNINGHCLGGYYIADPVLVLTWMDLPHDVASSIEMLSCTGHWNAIGNITRFVSCMGRLESLQHLSLPCALEMTFPGDLVAPVQVMCDLKSLRSIAMRLNVKFDSKVRHFEPLADKLTRLDLQVDVRDAWNARSLEDFNGLISAVRDFFSKAVHLQELFITYRSSCYDYVMGVLSAVIFSCALPCLRKLDLSNRVLYVARSSLSDLRRFMERGVDVCGSSVQALDELWRERRERSIDIEQSRSDEWLPVVVCQYFRNDLTLRQEGGLFWQEHEVGRKACAFRRLRLQQENTEPTPTDNEDISDLPEFLTPAAAAAAVS
jgi:hypothetical protein